VAPDRADENDVHVGVVTRGVAWIIDALLINLVAIITGLGVALVTSLVHVPGNHKSTLQVVGAVVYVLWMIGYFVVFWSTTGQTPGARVMQIHLVTARRQKVKPLRAVVRWVGMQLAAIPLFVGYLPIVFGRRGFPDWLARTLVVDAPQLSLALERQAALRSRRGSDNGRQAAAEKTAAVEPFAGRAQG
jgi:uncharacterized RDD family membrane protein YckC